MLKKVFFAFCFVGIVHGFDKQATGPNPSSDPKRQIDLGLTHHSSSNVDCEGDPGCLRILAKLRGLRSVCDKSEECKLHCVSLGHPGGHCDSSGLCLCSLNNRGLRWVCYPVVCKAYCLSLGQRTGFCSPSGRCECRE